MNYFFSIISGFVFATILFGHPKRRRRRMAKSYISSISIYEGSQLLTIIKGKFKIMALTLTDTQKASGVLSFVDKKGAPLDPAKDNVDVSVSSSDEAVATVTIDNDTNTINVVAGNPGVAALKIVATTTGGTVLPFDDVAIEVTGGEAVSGTIAFGVPSEQ